MNAAPQSFELVFNSELFFFESMDPDFIPVRMGQFHLYHFFQFLMFFGQLGDVSL